MEGRLKKWVREGIYWQLQEMDYQDENEKAIKLNCLCIQLSSDLTIFNTDIAINSQHQTVVDAYSQPF